MSASLSPEMMQLVKTPTEAMKQAQGQPQADDWQVAA